MYCGIGRKRVEGSEKMIQNSGIPMKSNHSTLRKIITSILFGFLGFFLSLFSVKYIQSPYYIHLQWSFVFPLLIGRAYGPLYGFISGTLGLGAFFPFLLWFNNGWANPITAFLYIIYYVFFGFVDRLNDKRQQVQYHPIIIFSSFIVFIMFNTFVTYFGFKIAFPLNPPFWNLEASGFMEESILYGIIAKEIILMSFGLLSSTVLLRINTIRIFFGLKTDEKYDNNSWIVTGALLSGFLSFIIMIYFYQIFITQTFLTSIFPFTSPYELVSLVVLVYCSGIIAYVGMEISERRYDIVMQLKTKEYQITNISNNLQYGMIYQVLSTLDGNRRFTYVSQSVNHLYSATPEMIYNDPSIIYSKIHPDDSEKLINEENRVLKTLETFKIEVRIQNPDNKYRWSSITSRPTLLKDGSICWDGIEYVITEQKEKQEYIEYISQHDYLTQLYNRRYYEQALENFNNEATLPLTLVMADVNGLKLTNDAFGHVTGDKLLLLVANALKDGFDDTTVIARIGGDEFIILMPNTTYAKASEIVDSVRYKLSKSDFKNGIVSVSFGLHTRVSLEEPIGDLFIMAEDQMYRRKLSEGNSMRNETIKLVMSTLFEKNAREEQHCERVSEICRQIGSALNLGEEDIKELSTAGLLHDIGKIGISETILNKDGELTPEEWAQIKRHPEIGYQILKSISEFAHIATYILYHHERLDGKGYPVGLTKESIPLQSKILFIADAYDAMTSDRAYRSGRTQEYAIAEIKKYIGSQFDYDIAKVFIEEVLKLEPFDLTRQ